MLSGLVTYAADMLGTHALTPAPLLLSSLTPRASVPKVADYRNNHIGSRGSKGEKPRHQPSAEEVSEW